MHPDLVNAFDRLVAAVKADPRCHGGWHYGSITHGSTDQYSDFDPVFLVSDQHFEAFDRDIPRFLKAACDELLILWPEGFNDGNFKNYCSVIRLGGRLHQLDFFVVNADHTEAWMCRQHLKGCTREHLIFDREGTVGRLLDQGLRTEIDRPDPIRALDTYWFHLQMLIKYFKRADVFKILKNLDVLFHAHVDLLLSHYDTLDWGAWESKVKYGVPQVQQDHLRLYFGPADLPSLQKAILTAMGPFRRDAETILAEKGLTYRWSVADQVEAAFVRRLAEAEE